MRKFIVSLFILSIITICTWAQSYSQTLFAKANKGNMNAQYDLAVCYQKGLKVAVNHQKAFFWFQKAATNGSIYAQLSLGECYFKGLGTPVNEKLAFTYFKESLAGGNKDALTPLGLCYYAGKGTYQDGLKAFDYFQRAAENGSSEGKACLGWCYATSKGNDSFNIRRAFQLWTEANSSPEVHPTVMYLIGMYLFKNMQEDNLKEMYDYFKAAANASAPVGDAILKLASMEQLGIGTTKNETRAIVLQTSYEKHNFANEMGRILTSSTTSFIIDETGRVTINYGPEVNYASSVDSEVAMGSFIIQSSDDRPATTEVIKAPKEPEPGDQEETKIFNMVEYIPSFPGGENCLMFWLSECIHYPAIAQENGIEGRVMVQFVVERDGSISDIVVVRRVDPILDKEAVRVVSSMPRWIPGKQDGKFVNCKYTLPVTFRLQ